MSKIGIAGNQGPKVRSDCYVEIKLTNSGTIELDLSSKVEPMFGDDIRALVNDMMQFFEIKSAEIKLIDKGALPFVMAARIEAAVKQIVDTDKKYLLPVLETNRYETAKDQFRFSRLYIPGNTPSMMINAGIHQANGIILDLEDAVAPDKKDEARYLVRNALCQVDFYGVERMVRINQGERGLADLEFIVPYHVNLILVPKVETPEQIKQVDAKVEKLKKQYDITYPIWYMPILESALGVENAFAIAMASPNIAALAIGLEDYTADLGVQRTKEGTESLYARMRMVNACKAAHIQPIDSVFSDVRDMDGLLDNVKRSKTMGFEGMGCIHPRQIQVIHQGFAPEEKEIEKAKKIYLAFEKAKAEGKGVISLGTKMIDPPVVKRAETTIHLAEELGLLPENWKETVE